jgi:hypothetical protein
MSLEMTPEERIARIKQLLEEMEYQSSQAREEVLAATEQLVERARQAYAEAAGSYQASRHTLENTRARLSAQRASRARAGRAGSGKHK